jgi:hypothetical protein
MEQIILWSNKVSEWVQRAVTHVPEIAEHGRLLQVYTCMHLHDRFFASWLRRVHRAELVAGEAALEAAGPAVAEAQAQQREAEQRTQEAEGRLQGLEAQLREKSDLIRYVEEEVERVKGEGRAHASRLGVSHIRAWCLGYTC